MKSKKEITRVIHMRRDESIEGDLLLPCCITYLDVKTTHFPKQSDIQIRKKRWFASFWIHVLDLNEVPEPLKRSGIEERSHRCKSLEKPEVSSLFVLFLFLGTLCFVCLLPGRVKLCEIEQIEGTECAASPAYVLE